jgi:hypothetical protein
VVGWYGMGWIWFGSGSGEVSLFRVGSDEALDVIVMARLCWDQVSVR